MKILDKKSITEETLPVNFEEGRVVLIDKPLTWTSFQTVKKLRYLTKCKKIGHAGTLDPLATGLLIICSGKATKMIESIQATEKEYTGEFFIGKTTPSYDLETEVNASFPTEHITDELLRKTSLEFVGEIMQTPPLFSALKVDGKRAYELARKGVEKELNARKILIKEFELTEVQLPIIKFRLVCSKGTYVRSLAYDFGKALQSGAYLASLRRTKIGEYDVDDAFTLSEVENFIKRNV
ncbi:MAG: tRNA pseudouridine(55) synthase TruB [Flammeovirgaceae bacterium]